MLLPFNVERPTRREPRCTYALIAANVAIYLLTIVLANVQMATDNEPHQKLEIAIQQMKQYDREEAERAAEAQSDANNSDSNNVAAGNAPGANPYGNAQEMAPSVAPLSAFASTLSAPSSSAPSSSALSAENATSFAASFASAKKFSSPNFFALGARKSGGNSAFVRNEAKALGWRAVQFTPENSDSPSVIAPSDNAPSDSNGMNSGNTNSGDFGTYARTPTAPPTAETRRFYEVLRQYLGKSSTGKAATKDESVQAMTYVWDEQHKGDLFVLEPHPTTLAWLAYWVGAPTFLGFFASMFLHGGLEHLLGNMLFLWVFGRALEDALGPIIYTLAYFVCGIAATLVYHIATQQFTPAETMIPSLGASGAVMGLMGLFAPRFYRTPINVFYTKWGRSVGGMSIGGGTIFWLGSIVLGSILAKYVGSAGYSLAGLIVLAAIVVYGEDTLWGEWKVPAAWAIAGYFVWNNILPVALNAYLGGRGDGVAHWAHIGGFFCGVGYAFLVGLTGDAKTEYITDAAESALENNYGASALESAEQLVKLKPDDPLSHRMMARAYDAKKESEKALDCWEIAIKKYLKINDRDGAAKSYLEAVQSNRSFILLPSTQYLLGIQMARVGDHIGAAETLVKIPYTFPEAPEGELALLRSAQLYAQHLHNPTMARKLLTTMLQRYPETEWKTQAEQGIKMTQEMTELKAV